MRKCLFPSMAMLLLMSLFCNITLSSAIPRDIVLMIDNSGSMKKKDPNFLTKSAATEFIINLSDDSQVAVIIFDHRVNLLSPLRVVTEETKWEIMASFDRIDYRGILTNIPDAMEKAIFELKTNGREKSQKSIIFITDGLVDTGSKERDIQKMKWLKESLIEDALSHGIKIYGIAFTHLADFELIQSLAYETKAEYFRAFTPEEIPMIFSEILLIIMNLESKDPEIPVVKTETQHLEAGKKKWHLTETPETETNLSVKTPSKDEIEKSPIYITEAPKPTPAPVILEKEKNEHISVPSPKVAENPVQTSASVKHVLKKPEKIKAASGKSKKLRNLPLPPPVLLLILIVFLITSFVIFRRLKGRKPTEKSNKKSKLSSELGKSKISTPVIYPENIENDSESMTKARIRDVSGVTEEEVYDLIKKTTRIGRKEDLNEILIKQDTISRQHAIIEYRDDAYWLSDQESANGTFLNGEKIIEPMQLHNGDTISIDVYDFEFIIPGFEFDDGNLDKTVFRTPNDLKANKS